MASTHQQSKQPRVAKIRLEESRQLVDCLILKEPVSAVDFKLLYSKSVPAHKARSIPPGTGLGWAKIMSNNQFISYVNVRYQRSNTDGRSASSRGGNDDESDDDSSDSDSDDKPDAKSTTQSPDATIVTHIEHHELPHIMCTHFFKDVPLRSLILNNNIKPPKPNAVIDPNNPPPRLPLVPSYMFAQKRLFVKWRYEIVRWWSRHSNRLQNKKGKLLALYQNFSRTNPEFRSLQLGKQWFFQTMSLLEADEKTNTPISTRLEAFHKELKFASEGLRQATDYVAPTTQRRIDQIREEVNQKKLQQKQTQQQKQQDHDEFDSESDGDDSDHNSSDDSESDSDSDSDSEDNQQKVQVSKSQPKAAKPESTMANSSSDSSEDSSSDSDSDSEPSQSQPQPKSQSKTTAKAPVPAPATKATTTQPRKNFDDSDSDSDSDSDDDQPPPSKKEPLVAAQSKQKILPPTATKSSKPVFTSHPTKRKNFDASDSDSDSDSDADVPVKKVQPPLIKKQRR